MYCMIASANWKMILVELETYVPTGAERYKYHASDNPPKMAASVLT